MSSYALLAHTAATGTNGGTSTVADDTFGLGTLNVVLTDQDAIVSLSANKFRHTSASTFQIDATIGWGSAAAMDGVSFRCGLYNVTSSAFATDAGGSNEIISVSGNAQDVNSGSSTEFVNISGRYVVASTADEYAIYMAGAALTGAWSSDAAAQGAPASLITTGSKPEIYKLVQIVKET